MDNKEALCAGCDHEYGDHFTTHNGRTQGCSVWGYYDSGKGKLCECDGFGYKYEVEE